MAEADPPVRWASAIGVELLTADEKEAIDLSGALATTMRRIIFSGGETTSERDWQEAALHIHVVQQMVMAQAAARAYPRQLRPLGGLIARATE